VASMCALAVVAAASAATPTRATWAKGANSLCGAEIRTLHALPAPAQGDISGTAAYMRRIVAVGSPFTSKIAALPRPGSERAQIAAWITTERRVEADALAVARALDRRDRAAAVSWLTAMTREAARTDVIARRLGAYVCAQS
jgi:hypothetical protein